MTSNSAPSRGWNDLDVKTGGTGRPNLNEVRDYHVARLNHALRRPGMWARETTLRLFLDAVAFVDGIDQVWQAECEQLRARGAFTSLGVPGAFARILPGYHDDGAAVASVYADIAWRHGWLTVDRTLSAEDLQRLGDGVAHWCSRDRNLDEVLAEFGSPSVLLGPSDARSSKTLVYAANRATGLICLHFVGTHDRNATKPQSESPPALLAIRHGDGVFADTFTFTPTGTVYRQQVDR
ncbi:hypothetical protein ACIBJE_06600 [Micromonospora sp. NPDC050187]|uniref:hypothetical protein n=1 Tax=Micromonospora sp. NPDC050187 TaxID=3364277 RepID=UPI0037931FB8